MPPQTDARGERNDTNCAEDVERPKESTKNRRAERRDLFMREETRAEDVGRDGRAKALNRCGDDNGGYPAPVRLVSWEQRSRGLTTGGDKRAWITIASGKSCQNGDKRRRRGSGQILNF